MKLQITIGLDGLWHYLEQKPFNELSFSEQELLVNIFGDDLLDYMFYEKQEDGYTYLPNRSKNIIDYKTFRMFYSAGRHEPIDPDGIYKEFSNV